MPLVGPNCYSASISPCKGAVCRSPTWCRSAIA
jgi:hypothetical protein